VSSYGVDVSGAYVGKDGAIQQLGTIVQFRATVTSLRAVAHQGTFLIFSESPAGTLRIADAGRMERYAA
jgi:hypothetical protein